MISRILSGTPVWICLLAGIAAGLAILAALRAVPGLLP